MNDREITIRKIRKNLKENIDSKTNSTAQNYFKERIKAYGVKTAIVIKINKELFIVFLNLKTYNFQPEISYTTID